VSCARSASIRCLQLSRYVLSGCASSVLSGGVKLNMMRSVWTWADFGQSTPPGRLMVRPPALGVDLEAGGLLARPRMLQQGEVDPGADSPPWPAPQCHGPNRRALSWPSTAPVLSAIMTKIGLSRGASTTLDVGRRNRWQSRVSRLAHGSVLHLEAAGRRAPSRPHCRLRSDAKLAASQASMCRRDDLLALRRRKSGWRHC
jgi:hypothetical protein